VAAESIAIVRSAVAAVAGMMLGLFAPLVAATAEPDYDPARFETTTLQSGLRQPMELAVAPDGTVFWIEFEGRLMSLGRGQHEPRLVGQLTVTTAQENGLIGLALDPHFADNGRVYLQYSPPGFDGQHVSRFTIRDGILDPASEAAPRVRGAAEGMLPPRRVARLRPRWLPLHRHRRQHPSAR